MLTGQTYGTISIRRRHGTPNAYQTNPRYTAASEEAISVFKSTAQVVIPVRKENLSAKRLQNSYRSTGSFVKQVAGHRTRHKMIDWRRKIMREQGIKQRATAKCVLVDKAGRECALGQSPKAKRNKTTWRQKTPKAV
jgi:hypothetical protein